MTALDTDATLIHVGVDSQLLALCGEKLAGMSDDYSVDEELVYGCPYCLRLLIEKWDTAIEEIAVLSERLEQEYP